MKLIALQSRRDWPFNRASHGRLGINQAQNSAGTIELSKEAV
jgi:hypothetical protein